MAKSPEHYLDYSVGYSRGEFNPGQVASLYQFEVTYGEVYEGYDFSATVPYLFLKDDLGNNSGIGDVVLRAGTMLEKKTFDQKGLYGSVALKLPTASASKGLGTGEIDLGGFLGYTFGLNEMNMTVTGGYIITGDSPSQSYSDIFVYGVGLSKFMGSLYVYGSLDGRQQAITSSSSDILELSAGFFYQLKATRFIKVEGYTGLNTANSDYGFKIGVVDWF